ncbi:MULTISPECIES: hypothetical protein [Comamonas]|uniref:Uncharacterized protein n=1 Tax=Comamonas squillarum TaxID=2977320 RepID=A0ABY6A589_9BURK|nr:MULTISPECIES: hypothetical protein [Comamonas]ULR87365.1 hypothetical protein MJ205_12910 [Comamonas sp. B21-038]UXC19994.1 hypothetical protein N4T19_07775 [Comamonas sp. PR12]
MFQSRYWRWHIKDGDDWSETKEHERWDGIKLDRPEAMPVLGTMVLHTVTVAVDKDLYDSLAPDIPF